MHQDNEGSTAGANNKDYSSMKKMSELQHALL
jgi:hypothetical protein